MDLDLRGKVAVVTGASKGIGLPIVRSLAVEGASGVAGARGGSPELAELAGRYPVHAVAVDLTERDGPARLVDEAVTGRFTRPEEVADVVVLLASGRAGNVTGTDGVMVTTL